MKSIHPLLIFLVSTLLLTACTSHPVMNINDSPVPNRMNGVPQTAETVRQGILAGCVDKGWNCREVSRGLIEASIKVRNHRATTEISYDKNSYNILYKNSSMLDYNERNNTIHRNYNRWVNNLSAAIERQLNSNSRALSGRGLASDLGKTLTAGVGDIVLRIDKQRDLENAFGNPDWFGRKTKEGFTELRYAGIDKNNNIIFYRKELSIETNETTLSRSAASTTTGSASTQINTNPGLNSATAKTTFSSTTFSPPSDYHVFIPEDTIPVTASFQNPQVYIEGYVVKIKEATPSYVIFEANLAQQ